MFEARFHAARATGAARSLASAARVLGVVLTFHRLDPAPQGAFAPNRNRGQRLNVA